MQKLPFGNHATARNRKSARPYRNPERSENQKRPKSKEKINHKTYTRVITMMMHFQFTLAD